MSHCIGIFGGSFDPVHLGHVAIAREAVARFGLERLWFVPAKISPLKGWSAVASDEDRLSMLRLATSGDRRMAVSDWELRRGGVSYTVETLRRWKSLWPDAELVFVAGMDSLLTLWRWRNPLEIAALCRFVTFRRPGSAVVPRPGDLNLPPHTAARLLADIVDAPQYDISSTRIRETLAQGGDTGAILPDAVARYIAARGIYRGDE